MPVANSLCAFPHNLFSLHSGVREKQLRLYPYAKPLSERFEPAFFRSLPKTPGVYLMFDARGRLLYVGQSHNLRQRIGSYRHVHPDRSSRKLVRLVHAVDEIRWEDCPSHDAAKLRENVLLRQHRPRFNCLNTWPKAHCFVRFELEDQLIFSFTREVPEQTNQYYGAFKSGCLAGFTSLLRLIWTALRKPQAPHDYPRALLSGKAPRTFVFELIDVLNVPREELGSLLKAFFEGESFMLSEWLQARFSMTDLCLFHQRLLTSDLEQLESFFRLGPVRNAELRRKHDLSERLIGQETLDDLLAVRKSE